MQPRRRRLWTWALTIAAAAVVVGATLSALFSFAMRVAPGYRAEVEQRLREAAGQPLRIGALALRWRGIDPVLVIDEVHLGEADGAGEPARIGRVELQFSPLRLAIGDRLPQQLRLRGVALRVHRGSDGQWRVEGLESQGGGDLRPALRALGDIARLQIDEARFVWIDDAQAAAPLTLQVPHAELASHGYRHRLKAQLQPPVAWARQLRVDITATGAFDEPASLDAAWSAQLDDIGEVPTVHALLAEDVQLTLDGLQLKASGHVRQGQLVDAVAQLAARRIAGARGAQALAEWRELSASAQWAPQDEGWRARIDTLRYLQGAHGKAMQRSSAGPFEVQLRRAADGAAPTLVLSADRLQVADVAPWLVMLRGLPPPMRPLHELSGELHHFELTLLPGADGSHRYELGGDVQDMALVGDEQRPGVSGLSGRLQAGDDGGSFVLDAPTLKLDWPAVFEAPLAFDAAQARLQWTHSGNDWRLNVEPLALKLDGLDVSGQLGIELPAAAPPQLNTELAVTGEDLAAIKPLLPLHMGPNSRAWLQRALDGGRITRGRVQIHGLLDGFPYDDPEKGRWQADLALERAQLAFARTWPPLRDIKAQLHFAGSALDIELARARIGDVEVDPTQGHIADLHSSDLLIDGSTRGDLAAYYAVLRDSPIRERLNGLLSSTEASGGAEAELHLAIPLHSEHPDMHASGRVRLDGAQMQVHGLDHPITGIEGQLSFGPAGVVAEHLGGQLLDAALSGSIRPEADSREGVLQLGFALSADPPDGLFAHYVPMLIRERLHGRTDWQLRLPLSGPDAGRPLLSSTLRGIDSRLPPPLRKQADEALPIRLQIAASLIRIDVPSTVAIALRTDATDHGVRGIQARFGGGEPPRAEADGIVVDGTPALVDVPAWVGFAGRLGTASPPQAIAAPALPQTASHELKLTRVDVDAQRLAIGELRIPHSRLRVEPAEDGYRVQLDGEGGEGSLDVLRRDGGRVEGRFDTLRLLREPPPARAAGEAGGDSGSPAVPPPDTAAEPPFEPASWPVAVLDIAHLYVGDAELGHLTLHSARIDGGQRLESLRIADGLLDFEGSGQWTRSAGASLANLDFKLDGREIGRVLQGLGYAETLSGERGHFDGQLHWGPSPSGLQLAQAQGRIDVEVERGAVRAVDPGAGRILGLFNIYALPRRLLLNFSDVTRKGLGFDTLRGHFTLGGGNAHTDDLDMAGPSVKLQVRGRIGLAARDFDEHVNVTPTGVSTGVAVGAAVLGGPAGAVIALLAQQLFDKPLDKLTRLSYRVTGSWDNPEITRGDGTPAAPASEPAHE